MPSLFDNIRNKFGTGVTAKTPPKSPPSERKSNVNQLREVRQSRSKVRPPMHSNQQSPVPRSRTIERASNGNLIARSSDDDTNADLEMYAARARRTTRSMSREVADRIDLLKRMNHAWDSMQKNTVLRNENDKRDALNSILAGSQNSMRRTSNTSSSNGTMNKVVRFRDSNSHATIDDNNIETDEEMTPVVGRRQNGYYAGDDAEQHKYSAAPITNGNHAVRSAEPNTTPDSGHDSGDSNGSKYSNANNECIYADVKYLFGDYQEDDGQNVSSAPRPPQHSATLHTTASEGAYVEGRGAKAPITNGTLTRRGNSHEPTVPRRPATLQPTPEEQRRQQRLSQQPQAARYIDDEEFDNHSAQRSASDMETDTPPFNRNVAYRGSATTGRSDYGTRASLPMVKRDSVDQGHGQVFLQYQDETKRVIIHDALSDTSDVRQLFLRAFGELTPEYLRQPHVRVYIQDADKLDFFYELDDVSDIKERSILRLREHNHAKTPTPDHQQPYANTTVPPNLNPVQYPEDDSQYYSESELDMADFRARRQMATQNYYAQSQQRTGSAPFNRANGMYYPSGRPSSALPPGATPNVRSHRGYGGNQQYGNTRQGSGTRSAFAHRVLENTGLLPGQSSVDFSDTESVNSVMSSMSAQQFAHRRGQRAYATLPTPPTRRVHPFGRSPSKGCIAEEKDDGGSEYGSIGATRGYLPSPYEADDMIPRSGSATPIIDEEARLRMISMEKQLASLSSLVHTALTTKQGSPLGLDNLAKDYDTMRREILQGNGGQARKTSEDTASETGSVGRMSELSYASLQSAAVPEKDAAQTVEQRLKLTELKNQISDLQSELKHVRRAANMNSQANKDLLRETVDRINQMLIEKKFPLDLAPLRSQLEMCQPMTIGTKGDEFWQQRLLVEGERERHATGMNKVDGTLTSLERTIEELRVQVVNGNRRLRVEEVETFIASLTGVGRMAACLKTQFPSLHNHLKAVMSAEMEKVVREEKFLKDEPAHLDGALRRCKKLTNTMITMKKLAMVQDGSPKEERNGPPIPPPPTSNYRQTNGVSSAKPAPPKPPMKPYFAGADNSPVTSNGTAHVENGGGHALDSLLEELQTVGAPSSPPKMIGGGKRLPALPTSSSEQQIKFNRPHTLSRNTHENGGDSRETTPQNDISKPPVPPPPHNYGKSSTLDRKTNGFDRHHPPAPMESTNALEDDGHSMSRSLHRDAPPAVPPPPGASSTESVNSQDGYRQRSSRWL